jgi:hypothetical protein
MIDVDPGPKTRTSYRGTEVLLTAAADTRTPGPEARDGRFLLLGAALQGQLPDMPGLAANNDPTHRLLFAWLGCGPHDPSWGREAT